MAQLITIIVPILLINILLRFVQFILSKEILDKSIPLIVMSIAQLVSHVFIVMIVNGMQINFLLFWLIVVTVPLAAVQTGIDSRFFEGIRLTKFNSFVVTSAISTGIYSWIIIMNLI